MKNNKIFIFIYSFDFGGAELQALALARELKNRGFEVVLGALKSGPLSDLALESGIECKLFSNNPTRALSLLIFFIQSNLFFLKNKFDWIITYTILPNIYGSLIWNLRNIWCQRDEGLGQSVGFLQKLAISRTNFFIANSVGGTQYLSSLGIKEEIVRLIPNLINRTISIEDRIDYFKLLDVDGKWEQQGNRPIIFLSVANLSPFKDYPTLIYAWECFMKESAPKNAFLIIAGSDRGSMSSILDLIARLNLSGSIRMIGHAKDVLSLMSAADIFVLSSRSEGMSNSVIEAASCALPVIGSDISGVSNCISPENRPFLSPSGSSKELAKNMGRLYEDEKLRKFLGYENEKYVSTVFNAEKSMCMYLDILDSD